MKFAAYMTSVKTINLVLRYVAIAEIYNNFY